MDTVLMGVTFSFTAVHGDESVLVTALDKGIKEVIRVEKLISSWDENSQTSSINKSAGIKPVVVDDELYSLIERSIKISKLTNGYFDISFGSIDKIWNFTEEGTIDIPSDSAINKSLTKIGYDKIVLDAKARSVYLPKEGMKIGFGGIGKGYVANRVMLLMKSLGIESGVINAGGDLISWGSKPNRKPWKIGIPNPKKKTEMLSWLDITDMAVVTSGNYEKFVDINGERYCHIINPKTGWPVKGIASVTIICSDAELADALATSVFVLGKADGMKLINHLNGVECFIVDSNNGLSFSNNLKTKYIISNENSEY